MSSLRFFCVSKPSYVQNVFYKKGSWLRATGPESKVETMTLGGYLPGVHPLHAVPKPHQRREEPPGRWWWACNGQDMVAGSPGGQEDGEDWLTQATPGE